MNGPWFSESGRLQLLWDSPIPAGLCFGMILPWLIAAVVSVGWRPRGGWWARGAALAGVAGVVVAIALTRSRGPLLAAGGALLLGAWQAGALAEAWRGPMRRALLASCGALLLAGTLTGAGARLREAAVQADGSARNRRAILAAAPALLWQRPGEGLGSGESGHFYSQWYQDPAGDYLYRGLLNAYCEIGAERGIAALGGLVAGATFLALAWIATARTARCGPGRQGLVFLAANVSLVVYLLGSVFGTFTGYPSLGVLVGVDAVVCLGFLFSWGRGESVIRAGGIAVAAAVVAVGGSWLLARRPAVFSVRAGPDHVVVLGRCQPPAAAEGAVVLVDREMMGATHGRALRRILARSRRFGEFTVLDPRFAVNDVALTAAPTVVLFGRASRFLSRAAGGMVRRVVLVHPTTRPELVANGAALEVWLAADTEPSVAEAWLALARAGQAEVRSTAMAGPGAAEREVEW